MTSSNVNEEQILVRKEVGRLLMLRASAALLRRRIAEARPRRVVIDFSGVEFMSRSFADEYASAKAESNKQLVEREISPEVQKMLDLVASQATRARSRSKARAQQATRRPTAVAL